MLSRYEASIERGLYRALHELERLQRLRAGDAVPPPEAVDVNVDLRVTAEPGTADGERTLTAANHAKPGTGTCAIAFGPEDRVQ